MRKNRFAALFLSLVLVVSMLGCKSQPVTETEVSTETVTSVESVSQETEASVADETVEATVEKTWMDANLPVEKRISLLMDAMTLEEKAYQMVQSEQANININQITETNIGSVLSVLRKRHLIQDLVFRFYMV